MEQRLQRNKFVLRTTTSNLYVFVFIYSTNFLLRCITIGSKNDRRHRITSSNGLPDVDVTRFGGLTKTTAEWHTIPLFEVSCFGKSGIFLAIKLFQLITVLSLKLLLKDPLLITSLDGVQQQIDMNGICYRVHPGNWHSLSWLEKGVGTNSNRHRISPTIKRDKDNQLKCSESTTLIIRRDYSHNQVSPEASGEEFQ